MSEPFSRLLLTHGLLPLVGAGLGFALGRGLPGALIGSVAGYVLQRRIRAMRGPVGRTRPAPAPAELREIHRRIDGLVRLLVALARVDGAPSRKRIAAVRSYFVRDARLPAIAVVLVDRMIAQAAAGPALDPAQAARALNAHDAPDRLHMLFVAYRVALAEGPMSAAAAAALERVARELSLSEADAAVVRAWFDAAPRGGLGPDYQVLGLDAGASAAEVHARYKDAVKRHHPDRFQHQGGDAVRAAEVRFKTIQGAYERLRAEPERAREQRASLCPNCRTFTAADEATCIRCGETKHQDRDGRRRLRCARCAQTNALPLRDVDALIRCGNCKVVLIR